MIDGLQETVDCVSWQTCIERDGSQDGEMLPVASILFYAPAMFPASFFSSVLFVSIDCLENKKVARAR